MWWFYFKFKAGGTNNYHCAPLSFKELKVLTRSRDEKYVVVFKI